MSYAPKLQPSGRKSFNHIQCPAGIRSRRGSVCKIRSKKLRGKKQDVPCWRLLLRTRPQRPRTSFAPRLRSLRELFPRIMRFAQNARENAALGGRELFCCSSFQMHLRNVVAADYLGRSTVCAVVLVISAMAFFVYYIVCPTKRNLTLRLRTIRSIISICGNRSKNFVKAVEIFLDLW